MDERELQEIIRKLNEGFALTDEEMKKLSGDTGKASKAMEFLAGTATALGKSALDVSKKMYEGAKGASAYNDAITGTTDAVGDLASKFGAVGKVIGFLIKAFGGYVAEANKLSDRLYTTYQALGRTGISAQDGMTGLADAAQKLGYGLDEVGLDKFAKQMQAASQDLALMAGSAVTGRKRFTEFSSALVRSKAGEELMNLGLAPEMINEAAADFVANQASLGRASKMTNDQLRRGTVDYVKELDVLSKLTGQNNKDIQSQMDANRREERFRAAIEKTRLEDGDLAARNLELNMAALTKIAPETAQGLKDIAAGFVNTEAAQKVFLSGMSGIPDLMKQQLGGGFKELGEASKATSDQFGVTLGQVGAFNTTFGNLYEQYKLGALSQQDYDKALKEAIETQKSQTEGADGLVGEQTKLRIAQMGSRDAMQAMVLAGVDPATKSMKVFSETVSRGSTILAKALGIDVPTVDDTAERRAKLKSEDAVRAQLTTLEKAIHYTAIGIEKAGTGIGKTFSAVGLEKAGKLMEGLATEAELSRREAETAGTNKRQGIVPATKPESVPSTSSQIPATGTTGTPAPAVTTGKSGQEKPISQVLQTGPGFNVVAAEDGTKQKREGTRAWRNNNPGNVEYGKFAASYGALGSDGRFAIFPTKEAGDKARAALLFGPGYAGLSIPDAISKYAPPTENNTDSYIRNVLSATGASANTRVGDLDTSQRQAMLQAMEKIEGFKQGKVTELAGMLNGGVIQAKQGGTRVLAAEGGMNEAFVPLPDGKNIPVKIDLKNFLQQLTFTTNPFSKLFSTVDQLGNENKKIGSSSQELVNRVTGSLKEIASSLGNQPGQLAGSLDYVKSMADKLGGAFDMQSKANLTKLGDTQIPDSKSDLVTLINSYTKESESTQNNLKSIMEGFRNDIVAAVKESKPATDTQMISLLEQLISLERDGNSTRNKILQVSQG